MRDADPLGLMERLDRANAAYREAAALIRAALARAQADPSDEAQEQLRRAQALVQRTGRELAEAALLLQRARNLDDLRGLPPASGSEAST